MLSTFFPVVNGRVTDSLVRNRASYQVQSDQIALQRLQTEISTGHRFQSASEDPISAIKVMGLQRAQEYKSQTLVNLKSSQNYLNQTESALSGTQDILNSIKGIALDGATNTISSEERDGLVAQLDGYVSRLATVANQRGQDRFLFAGGDVDNAPLTLGNTSARFHGDDLNLLTIADQGVYLAHNLTGQRTLGLVSDGKTGTADLNPSLTRNTRLDDLFSGLGIAPGAIQLSNGTEQITVDLANSRSIGDIEDKLDQLTVGGRAIEATVGSNGLSLNYRDGLGGTLRVSNTGSGRLATQLGIETSVVSSPLPIIGRDLDPIVRPTTLLSELNAGTGLSLSGGLKIRQGNDTYDIQFPGATTVEDVLNKINSSGAGVIADIDPRGKSLRIRSTESGVDFSISESAGNLVSRLGLLTFHAGTTVADLNHGQGLAFANGNDISFTRSDGTEFGIDLNGAISVQDVIDKINNDSNNQDVQKKIVASLNTTGNGIVLTSTVPTIPTPPPDPLPVVQAIKVKSINGSDAAAVLGLVGKNATDATAVTVGSNYTISGTDPNPQEVNGVFNSVIKLREAIRTQDVGEITRASNLLDSDIARISVARGELGIRQQRIDYLQSSAEDSINELKSQESDNYDVDIAKVITDLTARQAAYEANLRLLAQTTRTTIFEYI